MAVGVQIQLNDKLFIRDPQETKLGKNIIKYSILLIDEIGFEQFTFKKLAERISSTEASIYRYFENKHNLLVYLLCWYWEWTAYMIEFATHNVSDPKLKLRHAIRAIIHSAQRNVNIPFVDEDVLHKIVIAEGTKSYHTKTVDQENKAGFFATYKALAAKVGAIAKEINPAFSYPLALASTLLGMAYDHVYFADHLPRLTNISKDGNIPQQVEDMLYDMACAWIDNSART